mgnify:CR=1 FL=1
MNQETSAAAAKWWADKLRGPVIHDNGERMQSAMMTALQPDVPVPDEKIDEFDYFLGTALSETDYNHITVGVDYGPDRILSEAAEKAGINLEFRLPIKTMMWITPEKVSVSEGYRAPEVQIYPT